jgi:hypothetical protein
MIEIDKTSKNLLLINYPSGGYGFYLARLINHFVTNIVQTTDTFLFDRRGRSHSLPLVVGHIHFEQNCILSTVDDRYQSEIQKQKYVTIPYCPGILNDTTSNLKHNFPNAKIIRLCYHDNVWPLIFQNCILKAASGTLEDNVEFDCEKFGSSDDWARRENFSLLFTHHHYRTMWKDHDKCLNIDIFELLTATQDCLHQVANFIGGSIINLDDLPNRHQQFLNANPNTVCHLEILDIVKNLNINRDLTHINQLYHQAVLNFYLQLKFNFIIPSNDYADWFTNTKEIVTMLNDHGVDI